MMMNHSQFNLILRTQIVLFFGLLLTLSSVALASPTKKEISKPIKRLLQSIRLNKDEIALKSFAGPSQGELLFGSDWKTYPAEEQQRFVTALHGFFRLVAFPNIRKDFEHLETIVYEDL
jgi:phospholipid transport system substrate-binding protein